MTKAECIKNTFDVINKHTLGDFVTIRNFSDIPDKSSIKNDIDVMLSAKYLGKLEHALITKGFICHVDQLKYLYGAEPHMHFEQRELDVHFDIVTGLYYRSSNDLQMFVKVNDTLTKSMFDNKVAVDEIWINQPAPEDELVHLCCHAIFDKRLVKPAYAERINVLFTQCDHIKLTLLLTSAFYKVAKSIFNTIEQNQTSTLYDVYHSFNNY